MNKDTWKKRIIEACKSVKTYKPEFDYVIDTLADILEKRDAANKQYKASGGNPVVVHTNKAGAKNLAKNPALLVYNDLNREALPYWRDLGLTPSGLKKIDTQGLQVQPTSKLTKVLEKLDFDD